MITISVCLIARNAADSIAACLASVQGIADELIVVDTGSTDETREIAAAYADQVSSFPWEEDFSAARNYAFSQATQAYILWLDASEYLAEEGRQQLLDMKEGLPADIDYVTMAPADPPGKRLARLVRRSCGFRWAGAACEALVVQGKAYGSEAAIARSKPPRPADRDLAIYLKRERAGALFALRDVYFFAAELQAHGYYRKAALYYKQLLQGEEGEEGEAEQRIKACLGMAECYDSLGQPAQRLEALLRSLAYGKPRPEASCALGFHHLAAKRYEEAIYWFRQALEQGAERAHASDEERAHATWIPHLQLCVCYDRLGQLETAYAHNEQALAFHPAHPSMLHNRRYYDQMLGHQRQ